MVLNCLIIEVSDGDLIVALFHCHSIVHKQTKVLTAHHEEDRKCKELSKDILHERYKGAE